MSKNTSKRPEPLIPLQVKLKPEMREKLERIAKLNGLSMNDIGTLAIATGLPMVDAKLGELRGEKEPVAA
ncbi:MAG: hypothetical protein AB1705_13065 [Verrucomicrobiota bacterium]